MIHQPSIVLELLTFQYFFLYKYIGMSIWPFCKKVNRQIRIIIWTNLIGLETQILLYTFQGPMFLGSGEEDFQRVFTIYGHNIPLSQRGPTFNLVSIDPVVSEEMSFEKVDDTNADADDGACPSYKLSRSLRLRGANKISEQFSMIHSLNFLTPY